MRLSLIFAPPEEYFIYIFIHLKLETYVNIFYSLKKFNTKIIFFYKFATS